MRFNLASGNAISIDDPDSASSIISLRLTATNGLMTLGSVSGLVFDVGTGLQDRVIAIRGSQTAINAAIDTLRFQGDTDYFGVANIQVSVDDLGNSGTGGAKTALQNIAIDITPVNDLPVLTVAASVLQYIEGDAPLFVDSSITLSDIDNTTLFGARVRFRSGYVFGQDNLSFVDTANLRGSWNAVNGVLTIAGTGTPAEIQNALRSVTYQNLSGASLDGMKEIVFDNIRDTVNGPSALEATRLLQYRSINDAPVLSGLIPTTFTEGNVPSNLFPNISLSDADSAQLSGVTIQFGAGYDAGNDQLQWSNSAGVTAIWNSSLGQLTATGNASVSAYQSFLRSIAFKNSSEAPSAGIRLIQLQVVDAQGANSLVATTQISVVAVNDSPTALLTGSSVFAEGQVLRFGAQDNAAISIGDVDVGQGIIAFEISGDIGAGQFDVSQVAANRLTVLSNPSGSLLRLTGTLDQLRSDLHLLQFRPSNQFNGAFNFNVSITDDLSATSRITLPMTYTVVDDSPILSASPGIFVMSASNQVAIFVAPDLIIADADSATLTSAVLRVSGGFQSGDLLRLAAPAGFSSSWNSSTGTLTVTGAGSIDQYRSMLRTATFETTSQSTQDRGVSILVSDGTSSAPGAFERRLASAPAPAAAPTPTPVPVPVPSPVPTPVPVSVGNTPNPVAIVESATQATPLAAPTAIVVVAPTPAPTTSQSTSLLTANSNSASAPSRLITEANSFSVNSLSSDSTDEAEAARRKVRNIVAKDVERNAQSFDSNSAVTGSSRNIINVSSSSGADVDARSLRNSAVVERDANLKESAKAANSNGNNSTALQALLQKRLQRGDESADGPVVINVSRSDELKVDLLALPVQGGGVVVSAVVLWWLTRAGGLLTALLAAIPSWQNFDPLPILGPTDRRDDDDDEDDEGEDKAILEDSYET